MAETTEKVISQFTINNKTRDIADAKSREDIEILKKQIQYIAEQANINLDNMPE